MAIKKVNYKNTCFDISYDLVNVDKEKVLVFLHGWGSNKEIMKQAFKDDFKDYKHFYIDMPGFGNSLNNEILTTKDYANIITEFLKPSTIHHPPTTIHQQPLTIIGHSFGGKVATLLNPKNLVLLSSAGILEPKPLKVKLKIKLAKILGTLGLRNITKAFRSSDVEQMSGNMYETFKNVVDEDFTEYFKNYNGNCIIFWGRTDRATSLDSGKKIHGLIKSSEFFDFEGDHYFFLKHHNKIGEICGDRFI
ncbi:MAG: alpha/beta fold hydrolase [Sphaerochaetaceae bacterium]|nr:alpha/beta fold hydrolase [Sphaerochaetaceae bacterium]